VSGELAPSGAARFGDPAEAASVYAKGFFGTVAPDGALVLDRYEAVYLSEMGRVELRGPGGRPVGWSGVFRRAVRAEPGFPVRYLVYRDLRQRGYVVRAGPPPVAFSVLPRGGTLHKTPSRFWVEALSERELEVLRLVALGRSNSQIAAKLFLAVGTVKSHLHTISGKLGASNRVEAVARGRELGLLP